MKHSIFALPALLRGGVFLAAALQNTFSVQEDLLAFPQYDVDFSEDYVSESLAQARLGRQAQSGDDAPLHLEQYRPSDDPRSSESQDQGDVKFEYEAMTLEGHRYLCRVPQIKKPEAGKRGNDTLSVADEEKELARAKDRGWELLSGMEGNCVYFISGWWSYKFCYNEGVRQFHQLPPGKGAPIYPPKEDPDVAGFSLGKYYPLTEEWVEGKKMEVESKESSASQYGKLVQRGESRYLVQTLYGGTMCDLTGRGRKTEVQFHCNPQSADRVSLIKETSTCEYLMVIQTPRLCNDVAFLPPQKEQPNPITCSLILAEDDVADYEAYVSSRRQAAQSSPAGAGTSARKQPLALRPMVGDVELGAHNVVPLDLKLEKSVIVGGGKETYVDTVASSDGKILNKEALERLGLGDPKSVKDLMQKLEAMAEGQEWTLQVIDTPRGREYRGIIGSEDEDDKQGPEKGEEEGGKAEEGEEQEGSQEEYYYKDEL